MRSIPQMKRTEPQEAWTRYRSSLIQINILLRRGIVRDCMTSDGMGEKDDQSTTHVTPHDTGVQFDNGTIFEFIGVLDDLLYI